MTEPQMKKAIDTATKLGASKFILHDDMFDLWQITAETKRVAVEHKNLKLVTVDYAQLVPRSL
jgi:replicative DNA helicase